MSSELKETVHIAGAGGFLEAIEPGALGSARPYPNFGFSGTCRLMAISSDLS